MTIDDTQSNTQKTKDWTTGIPLITRCWFVCSGRISSSGRTSDSRRITVKLH